MNKAKPDIVPNLPETGLEHGLAVDNSGVPSPPSTSASGCGNKECEHAKACLRGEGQDEGGLREQINRI